MNNMQVAELCAADPGDKRCDDVTNPNGDDQLQSDSEQGSDGKSETLKKQKKRDLPVEQRHDLNTWQLPIGIYQSSRYTFRLAYSSVILLCIKTLLQLRISFQTPSQQIIIRIIH